MLLVVGSLVCLSNFITSHFAERNNKSLSAPFGPIGSESQTHVHSEVLLNFPIGREGKKLNSFLSHGKIIETQKNKKNLKS